MSHLMPRITRLLFYLVAAALLVWTASLTLAFVGSALPDMQLARYFALVVFDLGAVAWLLIFVYAAEGIPQRTTALILALLDLAGISLISFAEIFTGGQEITSVPADLATIALWSIGIWTTLNLTGIFAYHLTDTAIMQDIARKTAGDKITARSLRLLEQRTDEIADDVAGVLADRLTRETLVRLSAVPASTQLIIPETSNPNGRQPENSPKVHPDTPRQGH
jgi:hypothetical protein